MIETKALDRLVEEAFYPGVESWLVAEAREDLAALKRRVEALEDLRRAIAEVVTGGELRELPTGLQLAWKRLAESET